MLIGHRSTQYSTYLQEEKYCECSKIIQFVEQFRQITKDHKSLPVMVLVYKDKRCFLSLFFLQHFYCKTCILFCCVVGRLYSFVVWLDDCVVTIVFCPVLLLDNCIYLLCCWTIIFICCVVGRLYLFVVL